jgi:hypothetical protein
MPLHDWKDERGWDGVHHDWLTYLREWVRPRLPAGYRVYVGGVPGLTIDSGNGRPDVSVRGHGPDADETPKPATSVMEPDLKATVTVPLDPQRAVHVDFHGQLIAAIEVVSPRNKDRASSKETYTNRYLGYLRLGVHLMLIDVLPRPKDFTFAGAIAADLGLDLPATPAPFALSFRVGEPVPVGDEMGSLLEVWRRQLVQQARKS